MHIQVYEHDSSGSSVHKIMIKLSVNNRANMFYSVILNLVVHLLSLRSSLSLCIILVRCTLLLIDDDDDNDDE